ncbi:MAG: hypothetical protein ACTSVA_06765 [Candidatus Njordarchaeales archaeon]
MFDQDNKYVSDAEEKEIELVLEAVNMCLNGIKVGDTIRYCYHGQESYDDLIVPTPEIIQYYVARDDYVEKEHRFGPFKLDFCYDRNKRKRFYRLWKIIGNEWYLIDIFRNLKEIIYIQYKVQLKILSKDEINLLVTEVKKLLQK